MGDRRKPLHMGAKQPSEDLGLSLAECGKLLGDMGDRTVVLAQLLAAASWRGVGGGSVAVLGKPLGEYHHLAFRRRRVHHRPIAILKIRDPGPRELGDELVATGRPDESQRARSQVVVGLEESVPSGGG